MKKELLLNNLLTVLLTFSFLGLLFSIKLYGVSIIIIAAFTIIFRKKNDVDAFFCKNGVSLSLIALYALFIIGLLHSSDLKAGLFSLEKMLSLAILPVILASLPPLKEKTILNSLTLFLVFVSLACAIIWIKAFKSHHPIFNSISIDTLSGFVETYKRGNLTDLGFTRIHHPYLGLMIATAILIIFSYFKQLRFKPLYLTVTFFLFLFLIQLEAKMSLISLLLTLLVHFIILLKENSTKGLTIFLLSAALISVSLVLLKPAYLSKAVDKVVYADGGSRVRNWKSAIKAIKQAPLLGYGTGDPISALQAYRRKGSWEYQEKYNAHNQYLDIALRFGLPGLFYWLFLLGYLFQKAYVNKHYFFSSFILLFAISSLTEVLLARFHGVALFALILSIFANRIGKTMEDDYSEIIQTT